MNCIRIFLFVVIAQSVAEDIRSFQMSIMTDWQFQCINITCLPFITVTALNVQNCQITCLNQVQCQAASFQQLNSRCKLFANILNKNGNMSADVETITMIVISGTRMPPG